MLLIRTCAVATLADVWRNLGPLCRLGARGLGFGDDGATEIKYFHLLPYRLNGRFLIQRFLYAAQYREAPKGAWKSCGYRNVELKVDIPRRIVRCARRLRVFDGSPFLLPPVMKQIGFSNGDPAK
jgi:hypothetical protein